MFRPTLLAGAVLLATAPGALAADRYVSPSGSNDPDGCPNEKPCKTIQYAVDVASPGDTIRIAPGTYAESVDATKVVHLVGTSRGALDGVSPTRTLVASPDGDAAIRLRAGGSVTRLRAVGGTNGFFSGSPAIAVTLDDAGAQDTVVVENVIAEGGIDGDGGQGQAIDIYGTGGPRDGSLATVRDVIVLGAQNGVESAFPLIDLRGGLDIRVEDVVARPSWRGYAVIRTQSRIAGSIERVTQTGGQDPVRSLMIDVDSQVTVAKANVRAQGAALHAEAALGHVTTATVSDSLLRTAGIGEAGAVDVLTYSGGQAAVTLERTTAHARGSSPAAAARIVSHGTASLTAVDSILRLRDTQFPATGQDVAAYASGQGTAAFAAVRSAYTSLTTSGAVTATAPGEAGGVTGDPLFVNEDGGNLRLKLGSPVVDRGRSEPLPGGATDLDGEPRQTDGDADCVASVDLGAYEREASATCTPRPAPQPPVGPQPPSGPAPSPAPPAGPATDRTPPALTGLRLTRPRTLRWRLDGAATLRVTVERPKTGRRSGRRCVAPARARRGRRCTRHVRLGTFTIGAKAGTGARRVPARFRGRVRLVAVARDAAGNASAPRRLTVTLGR